MIEFPHPVPIESLASLKCENLAIRSNASDGFTVFLDFRERSRLSSSSTEKSLSLLQSHSPPNGLSFSGWVGFASTAWVLNGSDIWCPLGSG